MRTISTSCIEAYDPNPEEATNIRGQCFLNGHILLYYEIITTSVKIHNIVETGIKEGLPDYEPNFWDVNDLYQRVTLHEIGHSLLNGDEDHDATEGVMAIATSDWKSNMYFTLDNIKTIQENTRIR